MIDQALGSDPVMFGESVAEEESSFGEPITIKRFSSRNASPGAFGTPQAIQFTTFEAIAVVVSMVVASKMFAAGVLAAGDLVLQMRDYLNEGNDNIGGSQIADRVLYRGIEYRMVQRPIPEALGAGLGGDVPFWTVHLRRTNATTDTVGG